MSLLENKLVVATGMDKEADYIEVMEKDAVVKYWNEYEHGYLHPDAWVRVFDLEMNELEPEYEEVYDGPHSYEGECIGFISKPMTLEPCRLRFRNRFTCESHVWWGLYDVESKTITIQDRHYYLTGSTLFSKRTLDEVGFEAELSLIYKGDE